MNGYGLEIVDVSWGLHLSETRLEEPYVRKSLWLRVQVPNEGEHLFLGMSLQLGDDLIDGSVRRLSASGFYPWWWKEPVDGTRIHALDLVRFSLWDDRPETGQRLADTGWTSLADAQERALDIRPDAWPPEEAQYDQL